MPSLFKSSKDSSVHYANHQSLRFFSSSLFINRGSGIYALRCPPESTCFSCFWFTTKELICIFSMAIMPVFGKLRKYPFFLDSAILHQYVVPSHLLLFLSLVVGLEGVRGMRLLTTRIPSCLQRLRRATMTNHLFYWTGSCFPLCTRSGVWMAGLKVGGMLTM